MATLNLFDSKMQFRMPSATELEAATTDELARFETVREAVERYAAAVARRQQIESEIKANDDSIKKNDAALAALPKFTATDNAKNWIESQRRERAAERGY